MVRARKVGFSLVETIVIITILGFLAVGTVLGVNKQLSKARDAQRKLELKNTAKALEEFYDSSLCYPQALPACNEKLYLNSTPMLDSTPCDPLTHESYWYDTDNNLSCISLFKLYTNLENTEDPDIRYLGCTYGCGPDCAYNYGITSPNTKLDTCDAPVTPTTLPTPEITEGPSPTGNQDEQYVCAPGIGQDGHCTVFLYPELSECPIIWMNDPTCQNLCNDRKNHCKNSKGKKP